MLKLMQLELRKQEKKTLISSLVIITIITVLLFGLILFILNADKLIDFLSFLDEFDIKDILDTQLELLELDKMQIINSLLSITFIIFGATNYAEYVVQGVKTKELETLFIYPISRKKMMYAKVFLAAFITTSSFFVMKMLIVASLALMNQGVSVTPLVIFQSICDGIVVSIISLLAMVVGIGRKSTVATIVTGVLCSMFLYGNVGIYSISNIPVLIYIVTIVVFVYTIFYINQLTKKDLLN